MKRASVIALFLLASAAAQASQRNTTVFENRRTTVDVECGKREINGTAVIVTKKDPIRQIRRGTKKVIRTVGNTPKKTGKAVKKVVKKLEFW
jgi:hypothetical protein